MSALTARQVEQLLRPIAPGRVSKDRDGMSHLQAYDVRAHLDRIFGFARWSADVLDVTQLYEEPTKLSSGKDGFAVAYRATLRLTVCAPDGTVLATYTECATGDGVMPTGKRSDAHDFAIKTAESQALKRCAINLGDQFGLSLYAQGSLTAVVKGTLVGADEQPDEVQPDEVAAEHPDEHVTEPPPLAEEAALVALKRAVWHAQQAIGIDSKDAAEADYAARFGGQALASASKDDLESYLSDLTDEHSAMGSDAQGAPA